MKPIQLTRRQEDILNIIRLEGPITGKDIAEKLSLTRSTLRPDFTFLSRTGLVGAKPRVGYFYLGNQQPDPVRQKISALLVQDWMSMPMVIDSKLSVYDSIIEMFMRDVGSLFITTPEEGLVGIVSRKDLLKVSISQGDVSQIPVSMIMTRMPNLITCYPDEPLLFAAQKLRDHQIDSMPVVRTVLKNGKSNLEILGRVTKTNIVKAFVKLGN